MPTAISKQKPYRCLACNNLITYVDEDIGNDGARLPKDGCSNCGSTTSLQRLVVTHLVVPTTKGDYHSDFKNSDYQFICPTARKIIDKEKKLPISYTDNIKVVTCKECIDLAPKDQPVEILE